VFYHTVLFQFADDVTPEMIDNTLEHLRGMAAIPAVRAIVVGPNALDVVDGWTHGMTIVFDSKTSMFEEFGDHPLHRAVIRDQLPLFRRYMAMDPDSGPE
jgi:hypothetical protein